MPSSPENIMPPEAGESEAPGEEEQAEEFARVMRAGAGDRAGAWAFLALIAIVLAGLYFYADHVSGPAFAESLWDELLSQARRTVEAGKGLEVIPSWPYLLYEKLRFDAALFAATALLAAFLWSLSERSRFRRADRLVHDRLEAELSRLRKRLDDLEKGDGAPR